MQPHAPTDSDSRPPLKKQKLTRTVSINTVLQRVGSKEAPLADAVGSAPQTVQEMIPPLAKSKVWQSCFPNSAQVQSDGGTQGRLSDGTLQAAGVDANVDTLEIVEKLWGKEVAQPPKGPSLPLVVASEPPSLAAVGLRSEGGQVSEPGGSRRSRGIKREHSMERALHSAPKRQLAAAAGKAKVVGMGATSGPHSAHAPAAAAQVCCPLAPLTNYNAFDGRKPLRRAVRSAKSLPSKTLWPCCAPWQSCRILGQKSQAPVEQPAGHALLLHCPSMADLYLAGGGASELPVEWQSQAPPEDCGRRVGGRTV